MSIATRNTSQAAREIQDVLNERDVQGLGVVALSTAGGVIVAQEVADRALPILGFSMNPSSATGFAASGGVKAGVALGFGALATRLTGLPLVASAWMGVGALAGAGADLFNAFQRTGLVSEAPSIPQANSPTPTPTPTPDGGSGNAQRPPQAANSGGHPRSRSPSPSRDTGTTPASSI